MEQINTSSAEAGWMNETVMVHNSSDNGTSHVTSPNYYNVNIVYNGITLIIIVFGVAGNALTIIVLTRRRNRKSSTSLLYLCLAVSDLVIIVSNILISWILRVFDIDISKEINMCNVNQFLQFTSWENSSWTVVFITLERFVSVMMPFRAKSICRPRNALLVSLGVLVLLVGSNGIILFGQNGQCGSRSDALVNYFKEYAIHKLTLLGVLLPGIIIVFGNIMILRKVRSPSIARENSREGAITLTRTLVLVSATFLITQVPLFAYLYLIRLSIVRMIGELEVPLSSLSDTNAAINFILYMLQGSRFRTEVRRMFLWWADDTSQNTGT